VWLLDLSTKLVFWAIRSKPAPQSTVTEEEIKMLIAEAERAGVLETGEHRMISGVLRLGDRPVRGLMTPRTEVDWLDITAGDDTIRQRVISTAHSRLPAGEGEPDKLIGVVTTRELLAVLLSGKPLDVRAHVRKAPFIPDRTDALDALEMLRDAEVPMALIHDEYGHFQGVVTPADILEAIAGVFRSDTEGAEPAAIPRDDGSWLLSGWMPADEMADQLGITLPPRREYQTVAGFMLAHLRRMPTTGEAVEVSGWRFEIVDLDRRRVDKVLASRLPVTRRQL
jgi:putative hemolysin